MARRRKGRGKRSGRRMLRKAFSGGLVRGSMHPRTTSGSPWNNYVLTTTYAVTSAGISCLLSTKVCDLVKSELGIRTDKIKDTASINIRVTRIDMWIPPAYVGGDLNCIVFAPEDWTDKRNCADTDLNWYEAWGTAVQPAHAHYIWPRSIATQVITELDGASLVKFDTKKANVQIILKVHLQWRPAQPDLRPVSYGYLLSTRTKHLDYEFIEEQEGMCG